MIPNNISPRDSIAFIRSYVNDWVKTKVMIYQAQQNLPKEQLDFSKQLEDYRNSLIIYHYETNLINQNLDTIVSETEIEKYYNSHLNDFQLKENITKAVYVIYEDDSATDVIFSKIFSLHDTVFFDSLDYYIPGKVVSSHTDTVSWVSFYNIQKKIPIETYNKELFLKNNNIIKIKNGGYIYQLKFFDYKIKEDISPLDFKRNDIYNIIISRRKIKLAKQVRKDILDRALLNNEYSIYYND